MKQAARQVLDSPAFKRMVVRQWTASIVFTTALFAIYYGYIALVALDKALLARRVGEATTLGIPAGVAVIIASWALTAVYVLWANRAHDSDVRHLKNQAR